VGEFIEMRFAAHHSQEDALSLPDQASSDCYLSQGAAASVALKLQLLQEESASQGEDIT